MRMSKEFMCRFEEGTKRRAGRNVKRGSESRRDVEVNTNKRETVLLSQNNT